MKKKVSLIVTAMIIVVIGLYTFLNLKLVPPIFIKGSVVTEKGVVIENVITIKAERPLFLKVKKVGGILSGSDIKVIYSEKNGARCVQDAIRIKQGQRVRIHGVAVDDDTISTCGSADYYVEVENSPPGDIHNEIEEIK